MTHFVRSQSFETTLEGQKNRLVASSHAGHLTAWEQKLLIASTALRACRNTQM